MLEEKQKRNLYAWIEFVEKVIFDHRTIAPDIEKGKAGRTLKSWIYTIVDASRGAVDKEIDENGATFDGVMRLAETLGMALLAWHFRCMLSKIYDPRRDLESRQRMMKGFLNRTDEMLFVTDPEINNLDREVFNQFEWEKPFEWEKSFE